MIDINAKNIASLADRTALAVNTFDEDTEWNGYVEYVFALDDLMEFARQLLEIPEAHTWNKKKD